MIVHVESPPNRFVLLCCFVIAIEVNNKSFLAVLFGKNESITKYREAVFPITSTLAFKIDNGEVKVNKNRLEEGGRKS